VLEVIAHREARLAAADDDDRVAFGGQRARGCTAAVEGVARFHDRGSAKAECLKRIHDVLRTS
jgi:hypothetical protein